MRFRKLRIAFSATCLIACVLLIALWVFSYYGLLFAFGHMSNSSCSIDSAKGKIVFAWGPVEQGDASVSELTWSSWKDLDEESRGVVDTLDYFGPFHFENDTDNTIVTVPHWLLAVLTAAFAGAPWILWKRRFSLRTLLIATTLVAVVLGLAIYVAGK